MYNDIPKQYKIEIKKLEKNITYNNYKKTEVLKDLEKNIFSKTIEKSIFWSAELIISGLIDVLYERILNFYISEINISNIKLLEKIYNEMKYYYLFKDQDLINNQYFRNHTADLICYIAFSSKSKLPKLPLIKAEAFNMSNHNLLSKNLENVKKYISNEDPKEIIIPLSEIITNLYIKKLTKSLDNCMFWLSWILTYEKKLKNNNLICHYTTNVPELSEKLKTDFTWILWNILLDISNNKYVIFLYKLFLQDFKKSKKLKKINLIILSFILIINPIPEINYNIPIITDKNLLIKNKIIACINLQYKDLLFNKEKRNSQNNSNELSPFFSKEKFSSIDISLYV